MIGATRRAYQSAVFGVNAALGRYRFRPAGRGLARAGVGLLLATAALAQPLVSGVCQAVVLPDTTALRTADGSLLSALVYRPPAPLAPVRAVVWLGRIEGETGPTLDCLGAGLAARGLWVVAPAERRSAGRRNGASAGDVFGERQGDGLAALGYLLDSLDVPMERVILAGEETGAALAAWSASRVSGTPLGFVFVNPRFTVGDLDLLPIVRGLDRPSVVLLEEEVPVSYEAGRALYLSMRERCRLWQFGGAGGRLAHVLGDAEACDGIARDLAEWTRDQTQPN
ncbi:MAG: hypothetical protein IT349_13310 [Candidatus Eisenbacteria bacterium]|nr:hypothetical protein [Candidatus Eisenbacteria bacterium]MCC7143074.1 hypothetical protein [Candidatus Eisenbacteria bacterium]